MTNGVLTTELTAQQYARIRGGHKTRWLAFLNPNIVAFQCLINQTSFATSFAEVAYDNVTVGAFAEVKEGWTVYVSHTSSIQDAYFRGRVRLVPTSDTLYINWTSAAFQNNDSLWIIKETALHERLPRKSGGTIFFDYSSAFRQLLPYIENLPTAAAGKLTSGGNVDFSFAPTAKAATSGATISSWSWDADGGSFQVGSSSDQNVTIRFTTPGWREVRVTVTDSGGRSNFFTIRCLTYPADYSSIVTRAIIPKSLTNDIKTGWSAQFEVTEGTDLDDMLRLNEIIVVAEDTFTTTLSGVLTTDSAIVTGLSSTTALSAGQDIRGRGIPSNTTIDSVDSSSEITLSANATRTGRNALKFLSSSIISNVKFVGRIRESDEDIQLDPQYSRLKRRTLEADGLSAQLGRLILATVALRRRASPAEMGEIKDLTLWRGILFLLTELTTATTLMSLDFDSTSDDFTVPLIGTQDRSAADNVEDVAFAINAFFNWSPTGAAMIARHVHYMSDKSGVVTVANWLSQDFTGRFQVRRQHIEPMGRVIGYAGTFNSISSKTLVLRAKAPAEIWGPGEGRSQVNRQVLAANLSLAQAQFEVAYRTGAEYAARNLLYTINVTHPSGYDNVVNASVYQRQTWAEGGFDATKFWLCQRVQINYDDKKHLTKTDALYIEDITGINAQVIAEIAPEDLPFQVPGLPPFSDNFFMPLQSYAYPDGADIPPEDEQPYSPAEAQAVRKPPNKTTDPDKTPPPSTDPNTREGSVVMVGNTANLWIASDVARRSNPNWLNITPGTGIKHAIFDPHGGGGWALTGDGTDSIVWRAGNIQSPAWNSVVLEDELFALMGITGTPGALYAYGTGSGETTDDYDFTIDQQGWSILNTPNAQPRAVYTGALGFEDVTIGAPDTDETVCAIRLDMAGETVLSVSVTFDVTVVAPQATADIAINYPDYTQDTNYTVSGTDITATFTGVFPAATVITIAINSPSYAAGTGGSVLIKAASVTVVSGSGARTVYSDDNGATFDASVFVGDTPGGDGGFSARISADTVLAAADEKVTIADAGGAYGDATGGGTPGSYPLCIWSYGETGANFLLASAAAVSGETLWKVESGVATAITPNDGSNDGLAVSPGCVCTAPENDGVIFAVLLFGSTRKLARSTNGGTSWSFTTGLSSAANWVRAENANQVYIADGQTLWYSENSGATLVGKVAPGASLLFVEVR